MLEIISTLDSFVSRLLKVKYYPSSSFLDAELCRRPSFAWRSILGASNLLKQELIWRIVYGETMKIWEG